MKIKLITYHFALNYGAFWQTYALQRFLQTRGYDCRLIHYIPMNRSKRVVKGIKQCFGQVLPKRRYEAFKRKQFLSCAHLLSIDKTIYYDLKSLKKSPPQADVYITGSDQVWHADWTFGDIIPYAYFLDFGKSGVRRVAYAASLGGTIYHAKQVEEVKRVLSNFDHISLREPSSQPYISGLARQPVMITPDPVFLLNTELYPSKINKATEMSESFGLLYFLHDQFNSALSIIDFFQSYYHCEIKNANPGSQDQKLKNMSKVIPSPIEWIDMIRLSQFVLTNSYHGVIFSLLSHTSFFVLPTRNKNAKMNSRVLDLLGFFNLTERVIWQNCRKNLHKLMVKEINWEQVDRQIAVLQNKGGTFLTCSLN